MQVDITHYGWNGTENRSICIPRVYENPTIQAMAGVIYGHIIPSVAVVTLVANMLAILVFMTTNRKSPTIIILTVLAFSNMISIGIISPMFLLVFGMKKKHWLIECSFIIYHDAAYFGTAMFHCISIWLTVLLGIERYIVVGFPIVGRHLCSRRNTIISITVIFVASFVMVILPNMWSKHYYPVNVNVSRNAWERVFDLNTSDKILSKEMCRCQFEEFEIKFNYLYNLMRNIFGTLIPCLTLLITTVLLIFELKKNDRTIRELHFEENVVARREQTHMKRTSMLVMVITVFFVLTELPMAIFITWITIEPDEYASNLDSDARYMSAIICNVFVYVACTANFFILLLMSRFFRRKLKHFLCLEFMRKKMPTKQSHNTSSYNSKTATTLF